MGVFGSKEKSAHVELRKKIVMLGLDGAGKTTIVTQLKDGKFIECAPTIGFDIHTVQWKDCELKIFDVGGAATHFWSHYYSDLDALIFVVDSVDKARYEQIKMECRKIGEALKHKQFVSLILLNKQDLKGAWDVDKFLSYTKLDSIFESDIIVQKCSAKENWGLKDGMDKLVKYFQFEKRRDHYVQSIQH